MPDNSYLVAGRQPWNRRIFEEVITKYPGKWHLVGSGEELTLGLLHHLAPRYIFFIHWSWKIPNAIIDNYECVGFHMTDIPYGRGGSPLQNLIIRGHRHTKLTAFRISNDFDAGPVYLKRELCLEGNAEEIYIRATYLAAQMIEHIIHKQPEPIPQTGEVVVFKRRKSEESEIPEMTSLQALYDFVRMLDAEGYPNAFIDYKGFRYQFKRAALYNGKIMANVTITALED